MSQAFAFLAGLNAGCALWQASLGYAWTAVFSTCAVCFCLWRMAANMKKAA